MRIIMTLLQEIENLTWHNAINKLKSILRRLLTSSDANSPTYKSYSVKVTQSGTSAPTSNVLENTLGNTPQWTRESLGIYKLTSSNIISNKTTISGFSLGEDGSSFTYIHVGSAGEIVGQYTFYVGTPDEVYLETQDASGTLVEFSSLFQNETSIPLEIKIYNT